MANTRKFSSSIVARLIRTGCDVNCQDQSLCGKTPLSHAILDDDLEVVCYLLCHRADVNALIDNYGTHLIQAVKLRRYDICEALLDYCDDISFTNDKEMTAFRTAIVGPHNRLAVLLLERGASVNSVTMDGRTPLHSAMWCNDTTLFKQIWSRINHKILCNQNSFLFQYLYTCHFPKAEWLECLYLILNCPVASRLIRDFETSIQHSSSTALWTIMAALARKGIKPKDRLGILYIFLSLGAEVKANDFQYLYYLFGPNDEFEAIVYAGEISYREYKTQMHLLFKEPYNIPIPKVVSLSLVDYWYPPRLRKKTDLICALGFHSMSPEERKRLLKWIKKNHAENYNAIVEKLDKIPQVPSLLQLSRDQAQRFVEETFRTVKVYQFYDVVKSLELPRLLKDVLLFKQSVY